MNQEITIITPTTGKKSLKKLIDSVDAQGVPFVHILLWDEKREDDYLYPDSETCLVKNPHDLSHYPPNCKRFSIITPYPLVKGMAYGSALRAVGLMAAQTPFVTFADDDVWYDPNHLKNLLELAQGDEKWGFCHRKVYDPNKELIGVDNFESVGDTEKRKVPYVLVDNNTMIFSRRIGTSAACLYRETEEYNDDRLMTQFLYKHCGKPKISEDATVSQICPEKLTEFFRSNISNEA